MLAVGNFPDCDCSLRWSEMAVPGFAGGDEADSDLIESEEQWCSVSSEFEVVVTYEAARLN